MHRYKLYSYLIRIALVGVFLGLPLYGFYLYKTNTYGDDALQAGRYDYGEFEPSCAVGEKTGASGSTAELKTSTGIVYSVKTPENYDPTFGHPLLVVFAPTFSGALMEKYVGLTKGATEAGFVIVYVDGRPLTLSVIKEYGRVPPEVIRQWCIDEKRVYFTGHSDGGTVSSALAFLEDSTFRPTAIAPSAAGISAPEFTEMQCPAPLPVMIMHNKGDTHFPGFGQEAADWWAKCNQCDPVVTPTDGGNCVSYQNCASGKETLYCEVEGGHINWPRLNDEMIGFFSRN